MGQNLIDRLCCFNQISGFLINCIEQILAKCFSQLCKKDLLMKKKPSDNSGAPTLYCMSKRILFYIVSYYKL